MNIVSRHPLHPSHHITRHPPCVTKLPKFLPTTQCHVAPLRESNCDIRERRNGEGRQWDESWLLSWCTGRYPRHTVSLCQKTRRIQVKNASYLFNVVLVHRLDRWNQPLVTCRSCTRAHFRFSIPTSTASCCMSSVCWSMSITHHRDRRSHLSYHVDGLDLRWTYSSVDALSIP